MNLLFLADPDPTGLARGRYPAPAWVIWVVSAVVVALALVFLVVRARRGKKAPSSAPTERKGRP